MKHLDPGRIVSRCLALALAMFLLAGCERGPRIEILAPDGSKLTTVRVEIADTGAKRELGLMFRHSLNEDAGMIFLFPNSGKQNFWMKNTPLPLDMMFADSSARVVGIVPYAQPYSEALVGVDAASQYVLEVNGGFCARHRVGVGDQFKFLGFDPQGRD